MQSMLAAVCCLHLRAFCTPSPMPPVASMTAAKQPPLYSFMATTGLRSMTVTPRYLLSQSRSKHVHQYMDMQPVLGVLLTCWSLSVAHPAQLSNGSASFIGGPTVLHACWLHCLLCSCVSWPGISSAATVPLLSAAVNECYWMLNQTAVHMASQ